MFKDYTIWQILQTGGPVMFLLIFCSILSVTVMIERLIYYYKRSSIPRAKFMKSIEQPLENGEINKTLTICKMTNTPFASMILAGLSIQNKEEKEISNAMEREMVIQVNQLERYTGIVGTIGSTAVYIGLLGTVWGIIGAFQDIYKMGSGGVNVVIRGISEALVCTAAGLIVAVPAVIAYNYFMRRINIFVMDMELCASEVADILKRKK